jgi:hypothetical protein
LDFKSVTLPNLGASPKLSGNFHPNGGVWHPHGVVNFGRCFPRFLLTFARCFTGKQQIYLFLLCFYF